MFILSRDQRLADVPVCLILVVYHLIKQAWPRVSSKTIFGRQNLTHTHQRANPRCVLASSVKVCTSDGDTPHHSDTRNDGEPTLFAADKVTSWDTRSGMQGRSLIP